MPDGNRKLSLLSIHLLLIGFQVLQQHALYFDKDRDGVIRLSDTHDGARALGWTPC